MIFPWWYDSSDSAVPRVYSCAVVPSLLFFFSSRRRHTRCLSDWSSDVCSSDLDDHPDVPRARLGADLRQHFEPVLAGDLEVEDDMGRRRLGRDGPQSLLAVGRHIDRPGHAPFGEGSPEEKDIVGIVFHDEDPAWGPNHSISPGNNNLRAQPAAGILRTASKLISS